MTRKRSLDLLTRKIGFRLLLVLSVTAFGISTTSSRGAPRAFTSSDMRWHLMGLMPKVPVHCRTTASWIPPIKIRRFRPNQLPWGQNQFLCPLQNAFWLRMQYLVAAVPRQVTPTRQTTILPYQAVSRRVARILTLTPAHISRKAVFPPVAVRDTRMAMLNGTSSASRR